MWYKIGEIAELLGVSIDTLRLYDKKGIVSPKRGENGYRYYSRNQMIILNYVIHLKKANLSLEQINKLINETDVERSVEILSNTEDYIDKQLASLQNIKNVIRDYKNSFEQSYNHHGEIEIKKNLSVIYINAEQADSFKHMKDFHEKNEKYRFVFSFIVDNEIFQKAASPDKNNMILAMNYAYTYIPENESELCLFKQDDYEIINADTYAYFIIKCVIPTDYSEFYTAYNQIKMKGFEPEAYLIIRPTTIRNGEQQNIDYYEVFMPLK